MAEIMSKKDMKPGALNAQKRHLSSFKSLFDMICPKMSKNSNFQRRLFVSDKFWKTLNKFADKREGCQTS